MRLGSLLILSLLLLSTCIDQFNPKISGDGEELLVVEGLITDQEKSHYVKISRTKAINDISSHSTAITGAVASIWDDLGNEYELNEVSPGMYVTAPTVKGVIGRSYHVNFEVNGRTYFSESELLTPALQISDIEAQFRPGDVPIPGTSTVASNSLFFYLDIDNAGPGSNFYKLDWDATYIIESIYRDDVETYCPTIADNEYVEHCFVDEKSESFLNILSLEGYTGETYQNHFLNFIDPNIRLMRKYSLNAYLYSTTSRAYKYWDAIKRLTTSTGSLFDPPPSRIIGNIRSADGDEDVLGYFMASSVSQRREFFLSDVVNFSFEHFANCDCQPTRQDCRPPIPPGVLPPPPPPPRLWCCDCTYYPNSTKDKPSFWID